MNNLVEQKHGHNGIVKYPSLHKLKHQFKRVFRPKYIGGIEAPYDWQNPIPIPKLVVKNQFESSGCGGMATSYGSEVLKGTPMSAKSVYSRGYAPGGGMTLSSLETVAQGGIGLEADIASYKADGTTDEPFMEDVSWETPELLTKAQMNALGNPISVSMDVESIAQAIRDYKFVIFLIQGQNGNGWLGYEPAPPSKSNPEPIWAHYMCGVSGEAFQGSKGIVCYQSWGTDAGQGGKQFLSEAYIDSGYIVDCVAFPSRQIATLQKQVTILGQLIALWERLKALTSN